MRNHLVMNYRNADIADIPQMQIVRNSVRENVLSNPLLVTDEDYKDFITRRGMGWVCEISNEIAGFAFADLQDNNVWALFVKPQYENQGIGKRLHNIMLGWYFQQTSKTLWLGTAFNTRAEKFYEMQGWAKAGLHGTKEVKFEMTWEKWKNLQHL